MEDHGKRNGFFLLFAVGFWLGAVGLEAQTVEDNAWTNSSSGHWEDPDWSLGILPGPNQAILFTNAGWKALAIGPSTAQNYPQTMDVDSISVSSPTNSFNVLLLNYVGYQTPLTANSISLGSNTTMTILASVLNVTNTSNSNYCFEVSGTVSQGEFPAVNVGALRIGDMGPGIYNLTNGTLTIGTGSVGSPAFTGRFNQYGGYTTVSNLTIVGANQLLDQFGGGEYDFYDGTLGGAVGLNNGAVMKQSGGIFVGSLSLGGTYELDGGSFTNPNLLIPATQYNGYTDNPNLAGEVLQTGGTNQTGEIYLGGEFEGYDANSSPVSGSYVLSNGLLAASSVEVDIGGSVTQFDGTFTNSGPLTIGAAILHPGATEFFCGQYELQGGLLAEDSMLSYGYFTQSGGTNQVAGTTLFTSIAPQAFGGHLASYSLSGGLFTTAGVTVSNAVISQSGGALVTGDISLVDTLAPSFFFPAMNGFILSGGQLSVSSLQVGGYAVFRHQGGTLLEPGLLTLAGGTWDERTSGQQFGPLQVSSAYNVTNALLSLPGGNCILHFGDSSAVTWTGGATLLITNWSGSTQGGGQHQIIFGSSSSALTTAQLNDIVFTNPAGFPTGRYPARILSSGEIVPGTTTTTTPPMASAPARQTNGIMDVVINGEMGKVYGMEVSTNLVNWVLLSTQTNESGTMTFQDTNAPSYPQRFYRAYVEP